MMKNTIRVLAAGGVLALSIVAGCSSPQEPLPTSTVTATQTVTASPTPVPATEEGASPKECVDALDAAGHIFKISSDLIEAAQNQDNDRAEELNDELGPYLEEYQAKSTICRDKE